MLSFEETNEAQYVKLANRRPMAASQEVTATAMPTPEQEVEAAILLCYESLVTANSEATSHQDRKMALWEFDARLDALSEATTISQLAMNSVWLADYLAPCFVLYEEIKNQTLAREC